MTISPQYVRTYYMMYIRQYHYTIYRVIMQYIILCSKHVSYLIILCCNVVPCYITSHHITSNDIVLLYYDHALPFLCHHNILYDLQSEQINNIFNRCIISLYIILSIGNIDMMSWCQWWRCSHHIIILHNTIKLQSNVAVGGKNHYDEQSNSVGENKGCSMFHYTMIQLKMDIYVKRTTETYSNYNSIRLSRDSAVCHISFYYSLLSDHIMYYHTIFYDIMYTMTLSHFHLIYYNAHSTLSWLHRIYRQHNPQYVLQN